MKWARLAAMTATGVLAFVVYIRAVVDAGWFDTQSHWDEVASWLVFASVVAGMGCGIALTWMRPENRSCLIMFAGGVVMALWNWGTAMWLTPRWTSHLLLPALAAELYVLLRPLLFWLVLAWPFGRLRSGDRTWLLTYSILFWLLSTKFFIVREWGPELENPIAPIELARVNSAFIAFARNVVLPAGAIVLIVVAVRRHRRLPAGTRALNRLAVAAAVIAAVGDLVLFVVDRYLHDVAYTDTDDRRFLGGVITIFDLARFAVVPAMLLVAAVLASRRVGTTTRSVEIGPVEAGVDAAIAAALGDDTARVAYFDGGGWYDTAGEPVLLGGPGRMVAMVERERSPVAAVEHDAALDDRPSTVEVAVAAAASRIEYARLAALAEGQARDALAARRAIVALEDSVRRHVERDLHDGAQQRLVGLALQTSLAARDDVPDVAPIAVGVIEAREQLRSLAKGGVSALLAEHGLSAAIAAMAETAPLAVDVDVSLPAHLPASVVATAWFVVAEAVTNAVKHGNASRVVIHGRAGDSVSIIVSDDGRGGASLDEGSGLRGLEERARACGGTLVVDSPVGLGTTLRLDIPVAR